MIAFLFCITTKTTTTTTTTLSAFGYLAEVVEGLDGENNGLGGELAQDRLVLFRRLFRALRRLQRLDNEGANEHKQQV